MRQLVPHLVNVMFQNVHKDPASPIGFRSNRLGQVGLRYVPLADRSVLDAAAMGRTGVGLGGQYGAVRAEPAHTRKGTARLLPHLLQPGLVAGGIGKYQ